MALVWTRSLHSGAFKKPVLMFLLFILPFYFLKIHSFHLKGKPSTRTSSQTQGCIPGCGAVPAQRMPESSRAPGKCQGNHSSKAVIICYLSLLFVGCLITVQDGNIWGKDNFLYQNSRLHWFKAAIRDWELSLRTVSLSSNSTFYIFLPLSRNFFRKVSSLEKTCLLLPDIPK